MLQVKVKMRSLNTETNKISNNNALHFVSIQNDSICTTKNIKVDSDFWYVESLQRKKSVCFKINSKSLLSWNIDKCDIIEKILQCHKHEILVDRINLKHKNL